MNIKTKETYSELYQILNLLGNEYIGKLPNSLFNMLKEKRNLILRQKTNSITETRLTLRNSIRREQGHIQNGWKLRKNYLTKH